MLLTLAARDALDRLREFDTVIDARSPAEFAEDRLPGACNWPSLNDDERREVGTLYKQVSPFVARKRGAALVASNIARHIERELGQTPKQWRPLVYCWRGGKRSGSLALVLSEIGFGVTVLEGGYKAFRQALLADLPAQAARLHYRVVCGPTGSGKTRLLQALARAGAQVLDLEALANHRSSVLGQIPGQPQPSQKQFDTRIWQTLKGFEASRPVFVESESKKVGNLSVPDSLMAAVRAAPCVALTLPNDERVALLLEDYAFFQQDPELFCDRLDALTVLRGKAVVQRWKDAVRAGGTEGVVRDLLARHYDPGYANSMARNFAGQVKAHAVHLHDRSTESLDRAARDLIARG